MVIATAIADAGFFPLVTRESSRDGEGRALLLTRAAARRRWPLWVAILVVLQASSSLGVFPYGLAVGAAAVGAISQAQIDTAFGELSARRRFAAGAALRLSSATLSLLFAVSLTAIFDTALAAMAGFALGRAVPAVAIALGRAGSPASLRWAAATSFAISNIVISLYVRNDLILLSLFDIPAAEIARYGIAYGVLGAVQLVPASLAFVAFTRFSRSDQAHSQLQASLTLRLSYSIGALIAAAIFLHPPTIFSIFGSTYSQGVETVEPLLLLILPVAIGQPALAMLQARDLEHQGTAVLVATMVINIVANLFLIPAFGAEGAVWGTTCAELFVALGTVTLLARAGFGDLRLPVFVGLAVPLAMGLSSVPNLAVSAVLLALAASAGVSAWASVRKG
jgi:O-antigen/teichoic acid export membrane protein